MNSWLDTGLKLKNYWRIVMRVLSVKIFMAAASMAVGLASTSAGAALDELRGLAAAAGRIPVLEAPPVKKWGVGYLLDGRLDIRDGRPVLNTPDGRLFLLEISEARAREFDGKTVLVGGKVMQADDLDVLKVTSVETYSPPPAEPPVYSPAQRRVQILADEGGVMTASNVRWLYGEAAPGKFDWATARIRPELVKDVYFIKKPFPPEWIAAHSMLAYTFEKGGLTDAAGNEASGLVLSVEAYLKEGQSYGIIEGMKDRFGIVWVMTTWEEYSAYSVLKGERLIPYKLKNFSAAQKRELVRESVRLAAVNRDGEFYNTVTNNCTNNLVILMNRVLPEIKRVTMWNIPYLIYNIEATMPVIATGYLRKKGLLGPELPTVDASNYKEPLP